MSKVTLGIHSVDFSRDVELYTVEITLPGNEIHVVKIPDDYLVPFSGLAKTKDSLVC